MALRSRSLRSIAISTVLCTAAASVSVLPGAIAAPSANAGPKSLVALGDSFAAGPLIPVQYEQPWGCLRSSNNYAHQLASELDLELTDVTCSGADTGDMWDTHGVSPEKEFAEYGSPFGYEGHPGNPPQLDALQPDTDLVTLQIGGNDIGFGSIATTCGQGALTRTGCAKEVAKGKPLERIEATRVKLRDVLDEIHRRAPDAAVYVLGYSGIFKIGPTAGCPAMGVEEEDALYLRDIHERLNKMIREVADETGRSYSDTTEYVDVYTPSAGHTACDLPLVRWVEPFVPVNAAAPVHPNLGGMTAVKDILVGEVWPAGVPRRDTLPGLPAPPDVG